MSVRDVGLRIRTVLIDTSSCIPFIRGIGIVNLSLLFWVLFSISEVIVCRLACIEIPICTNTCPYVSSVLYWLYKLSTYRHIFYTNSLVTGMYSIHTTCKGNYWVHVVHVFNINTCQYRLNTYHNTEHNTWQYGGNVLTCIAIQPNTYQYVLAGISMVSSIFRPNIHCIFHMCQHWRQYIHQYDPNTFQYWSIQAHIQTNISTNTDQYNQHRLQYLQ